MKDLKYIIIEKLRLDKNLKHTYTYTCQPKDWDELRSILEKRLKKDKNADLNDIDVSLVTDMGWVFADLDPHDIKINKWDVSNVQSMRNMFNKCENFKGIGLENWDVSNVKDMESMFFGCIKFDCDLSNWDVSKVKNMSSMFFGCIKFDCDLNEWNVSNIKNMSYIFYRCDSLKKKPDWYKVV